MIMVKSHLMISFSCETLLLFFATTVHQVQVNLKTMFQFQSKLVIIHFKSYKQSVQTTCYLIFLFLFYFEQVWAGSSPGCEHVLGRDTLQPNIFKKNPEY